MDINEAKNRTLTIEKILDASIDLVWEAWSQPEHIAHWWAPKGLELEILEHDFSIGGKWKYSMKMPNDQIFISEGQYKEINAPNKLVTTADFKPMTEGVELYIFLEAIGHQTKFTFHCVHKTEAYCKQQEEMGFYNGWGSVFGNLEEYLQGLDD